MLSRDWAVNDQRWMLLLISIVNSLVNMAHGQPPPAAYLQTPSSRQLEWHRQEYYAFVHLGPNTFTNEEWGRSQSPPGVFNPSALDTDQRAKSFADAGMAGMILTAKHHDGMALWDSNTTTYKIGNGAWAKDRGAGRGFLDARGGGRATAGRLVLPRGRGVEDAGDAVGYVSQVRGARRESAAGCTARYDGTDAPGRRGYPIAV
ncbi:glycoside hydrolase superfamily [Daldinia caldariorum]|uniref:glycoside hydrolase superfamily n=1 Tax=Daldinia caldariorum TaxID=326644 RepID=UPI0020080CE3|nr:glycoside hydrolase superfamily [Daldinia caldariorum]KAI1464146.1 glycoside hydrolase superfamily [Daldinia caldariorum]